MSSPELPLKRVRSRAPLRIGLAGGGTDVSPYSEDYGGAILNATIDRYAYAFAEPSADGQLHFIASDIGVEEALALDCDVVATAKLKLHAAVYRRFIRDFRDGMPYPMTLRTFVEAPPGSGLGSSSALVVAMIEAFRGYLDVPLGPYEVAHLAFEVERVDLGLAGGKQDQYAAAFGGINFMEFMANDRVIVSPLRVPVAIINEVESSLVLCFSGISRRSEQIIDEQRKGMVMKSVQTLESLHQLKRDAVQMKQALLLGDIPAMAETLARSWLAKKETAHGVSTAGIDRLCEVALATGALAGKVSGAGGGGFVMFIVRPEDRLKVIRALNDAGGTATGAQLTQAGAEYWSPSGLVY